ncbi:MAG: glutamate 5-kinase [Cytophagales bacterium]|nr:glutamate 5-kinase [Bernardetiaceae bacterium]MDW8205560.1 glutamate 5-kinase [Cytophagales bacterium]
MKYSRVVVKIGSNVLATEEGLPDETHIAHLVEQIAALRNCGLQVLLVSSGAVASARGRVQLADGTDQVTRRQVLAAVGQIQLLQLYHRLFEQQGITIAQVLVTKDDFRDRNHYFNIKNCFSGLLQHHILPIINENDVVSVTELMFTDNDELAGLVASMMDADALLILSNVEGIYTGHPQHPESRLIEEVSAEMNLSRFISTEKSGFGRGGMLTKTNIARRVAQLGIGVHIVNGKRPHILTDVLLQNLHRGTYFKPHKKVSGIKKRIAHSRDFAKGKVFLNQGAVDAITSERAISLLPVGVTHIEGQFEKGDLVQIYNPQGELIGVGVAQYGAEKAKERIGKKGQKPLVHYDYLFIE